MKVILLVFSVVAAVYALPATREIKDEVEFVPLENQYNPRFRPVVVDTGFVGGGSPWLTGFNPFEDFLGSIAGIMESMRRQLNSVWNRIPIGNRTEDLPFPGFPGVDLKKANTTSVTKTIDGHKVVINETEYSDPQENGGTFFKVRIIDVMPDSSELTTEKNSESITPLAKEPEPLESSLENEIPKNREIEGLDTIEAFDEVDGRGLSPLQKYETIVDAKSNWASLEPFESFEDNSIDSAPSDLSRDTYVNQLLADRGAPVNPDAEVFSNVEYVSPLEKITNTS